MRNINLRYVDEEYDDNGVITKYKLKYPENYNFGYDVVDDIASNEPDRLAIVWCNPKGVEKRFTFGDISRLSNKTANYFKSIGIKKGDAVLVILKRHYQFWYVSVALHKIGAIMVPATFMLTKRDIEYRVQSASIKAAICTDEDGVCDSIDASEGIPSLEIKMIVNHPKDGWRYFDDEMESYPDKFERVDTKATEPMLMYFSSGTSGYPKMVLHDHLYSLAHLFTAKHWQNVDPEGIHFTIADTGWGKAVWGKYYGQWIAGANVFVYDFEKFEPVDVLHMIHNYHITSFCAPPTVFRFLIREDLTKFDLSSLKYCTIAGEALNPSVFDQWYKLTGIKLMEGFGQTETTLTVATYPYIEPKPGSMGKQGPVYDIDLLTSDGRSAEDGEQGEIIIRTDRCRPVGLFKEYYRDPELTHEAYHDNVYHTGDVAWRDEDGYYWFVGRKDDVIKSSGYRIGPFEVESALMTHPAVVECAITGVPDEIRGQVVKATIVLSKEYKGKESPELIKEIQDHVKRTTAPYKYPRIIEFVDELPKTISGKIRRVEIRDKK